MYYIYNNLVHTEPTKPVYDTGYDKGGSYPLTLNPLKKLSISTRSRVLPASSSQTATHDILKSTPSSLTMALSTAKDATLVEIMARSTPIHIYSLLHLEESLRRQWERHDSTMVHISLMYDKPLDLQVVLKHIDKLPFQRSLRLWIVSGHIFIKMALSVHDTCTTHFRRIIEDTLRGVASGFGGEDHNLFSLCSAGTSPTSSV
ncbi:hypothetical protein VKT23_009438 [Stygiomarasmius scandens]|uniref:Uncharacterized protein n=1 Tax=Marasmiellus scandens TaxID=2682957 RepID=A0ABR1JJ08_9AGAR